MIQQVQYATLINYSPRGNSPVSAKSRIYCGQFKNASPQILDSMIKALKHKHSDIIRPFLDSDTALVPAPKSSLIKQGMLWTSLNIAEKLNENGYGSSVLPCIERIQSIPKSSNSYSNTTRPQLQTQYDSIRVNTELFNPSKITIIDDVLTLGRTSFACAMRLHEAFPDATISVFCAVRTQGLIPNISKIFDPSIGEIQLNSGQSDVSRIP